MRSIGRYVGTDTVIFDDQTLKDACNGTTTAFGLGDFHTSIVGLQGAGRNVRVECTINGVYATLLFDCLATPQFANLNSYEYLAKRYKQLVIKLSGKTFDTSYESWLPVNVSYIKPVISNINVQRNNNRLVVNFCSKFYNQCSHLLQYNYEWSYCA